MYSYRTNIMGPMTHWYETNNIPYTTVSNYSDLLGRKIEYKIYDHHWFGGRIDIYTGEPYPEETHLPIMRDDSFNLFSQWLRTLKVDYLLNFEQLRELYEQSHPKLILFKEL